MSSFSLKQIWQLKNEHTIYKFTVLYSISTRFHFQIDNIWFNIRNNLKLFRGIQIMKIDWLHLAVVFQFVVCMDKINGFLYILIIFSIEMFYNFWLITIRLLQIINNYISIQYFIDTYKLIRKCTIIEKHILKF